MRMPATDIEWLATYVFALWGMNAINAVIAICIRIET